MRLIPVLSLTMLLWLVAGPVRADDGYRLWLRYDEIVDSPLRKSYTKALPRVFRDGDSPQLRAAEKELLRGLSGLLGSGVESTAVAPTKGLILGVLGRSASLEGLLSAEELARLRAEGYALIRRGKQLFIAGKDDRGALYGAFAFLRYLQRGRPLGELHLLDGPRVKNRLLNHWDNLDGTVERGYAGFSIWNWHQLPHYLDPRYTDYARANASIGINGAVVTNVNAKAIVFRHDYLQKAAALAEVFRTYGIKIYLTARFSAPMELGGLPTADSEDTAVKKWWRDKASEIYALIPDFGGFVVKANSEGQPGPREYGRTHAQGANLLADALAPHGGIVMWRAFVYSNEEPVDRAKQAYDEFVPLDGKFRDNVMVQVKNGPIDFQPREPVHPLFGAMPQTPLAMEFQITKEYLGQGTHLVGLGKMYEEVLQTDTYAEGPGTRVADIIDGSAYNDDRLTAMAGVANIGTARNWTSNLFGQADWYTFGRLAWDPAGSAEDYFREWAQMTFAGSPGVQKTAQNFLAGSHEACVNYMTPMGLHHIMGPDHHYGPGPWVKDMPRADWTSVYYHKADAAGLGFDRTQTGSDALEQYDSRFAARYESPDSCPPAFLLWYHHLAWDHKMPSGNTLWVELCQAYHSGAAKVGVMLKNWKSLSGQLDQERYESVLMHLEMQEQEATWWRDACLAYFQSFSGMPIPAELEKPTHTLEYYEELTFPYAPGIKAKW